MYVCAKKKNKAVVGGMFLSLALTAIITGITEPIEFAFMFLSPILYVIHAILTGISLAVAYALNVHLAFSFSGGLIDYILYFGKGQNQLIILLMGLVAFVVYYFLFMFFIKKFNLKTPGREDDFDDENEDVENNSKTVPKLEDNPSKGGTLAEKAEVVLVALGGKENIEVLDNCITRLRLTLKDASKIDEVTLKKAGASGIMKLDGKNVQVIMGTLADPLASQMKKLL